MLLLTTFAQLRARLKNFLGGWLLGLGIKEDLVECATVCVESVVILTVMQVQTQYIYLLCTACIVHKIPFWLDPKNNNNNISIPKTAHFVNSRSKIFLMFSFFKKLNFGPR